MRGVLLALAIGTIIGLSPALSGKADAQRMGRGGGGGIGRVGGVGGIGRVGIGGPGIGRVGVRPGIGRVGFVGRPGIGPGFGRVGVRYAGLGASGWGGYRGWGVRRAAWGGYPGWRVRRAAWWGAPLAFGVGFGALAYGSCYRWDPYYGTYVNVCYGPSYAGYYGYY